MKGTLLTCCIVAAFFHGIAQHRVAIPQIINYNNNQYRGGLQNWDIAQDSQGIMYFGNNEGLLTFNGRYWNIFPLPNATVVRSVAIDKNNQVYVGGQDELGYFQADSMGRLRYHSMIYLIPETERKFADVWDIAVRGNEVFFRTNTKITNPTSSYAIRMFDQRLYIGTSNGLYTSTIDANQSDISLSHADFTEVDNTEGQVWGLDEINNRLLMGHEDGAYEIVERKAHHIYTVPGTWLFQPVSARFTFEGEYDVTLTAVTPGGTATTTKQVSIAQSDPTACNPNRALGFIAGCTQKVWKLNPEAGAFKVGDQGPDAGNWWSSTADDITGRACEFNDEFTFYFNAEGTFIYDNKGDFYADAYLGSASTSCEPASNLAGDQATWNSGTFSFSVIEGTGCKRPRPIGADRQRCPYRYQESAQWRGNTYRTGRQLHHV